MSARPRTLLALLAVLIAGEAHAAALPGFALRARTARLSFFTRGSGKVEAEKSERFLAKVEQRLGHRFVGQAEYYLYAWPEEIAFATGVSAAGLTLAAARQIHSTQSFHPHEIVHLVAGQLGDPGALFQEGLAVALGDEGKWAGRPVDPLARTALAGVGLQRLFSDFRSLDPHVAYPLAGSFVRFLIERHGEDAVSRLFRACTTAAERDQAFARVFGRTLAAAGEDWAAQL